MFISRTSQYAIQALICIGSRKEGTFINVHDLAGWLNMPGAYLAKILQTLSRGGLLISNRGRLGGFSLKIAAEKVSLMQVLAITEGPHFNTECLLGLKQCGDDTACPMHTKWKPIKAEILEMLESQTLAILATAVTSGRYRLADVPDALITPLLQPDP